MSYTPNLNLLLTPEDDTTTTFKDWRVGINGEEGNSNMAKIDEAYGALNDQTQKIQSNTCKISTYASVGADTAIETVTVAEGEAGTAMPTLHATATTENTNCVHRMRYGC